MTIKYPPSYLLNPEPKKPETTMKDLTTKIINYEDGTMEEPEIVEFFQELIDSGLAWRLQGHYGRTAESLIDAGLCTENEKK